MKPPTRAAFSLVYYCIFVVSLNTAITAKAVGTHPGVREKLLAGEDVNFDRNEPEKDRTIEAAWIREAALKHANISVGNAIVRGVLILTDITFDQVVSLGRCDFKDGADFSRSVFKSTLVTAESTFHKAVFFDGVTFEHDAYIQGTKFAGEVAVFSNFRIRGLFFADGVKFGRGVRADFVGAEFEKTVSFKGASFGGDTDFSGARFGIYADFSGTMFGRKSSFVLSQFENAVEFTGAVFSGDAIFNSSHIKSNAIFRGQHGLPPAHFQGMADFKGAEIDGVADFSGVVFGKVVDFGDVRIEGDAVFSGALFRSGTIFQFSDIGGSAIFSEAPSLGLATAKFEGPVNFTGVSLRGNAEFSGAEFNNTVEFEHAIVSGRTIFWKARFLRGSRPSFRGTRFRQEAWFDGAEFGEGADFRGVQFDGESRFSGVRFSARANFRGARFLGLASFNGGVDRGGIASLPGATFQEVEFDHAVFASDARFDDASFMGPASFRETVFRAVFFSEDGVVKEQRKNQRNRGDAVGEQFQSTVDLRGCTYQRIQVHWWSLFHRPNGGLRLEPYDRQPYSQLEQVLRTVGQDDEADAVYLDRRQTECKLKWHAHQFLSWLGDEIWGRFANYGVSPFRLLVYAIILLILGMQVFSQTGAVSRKGDGSHDVGATPTRLSRGQAFFLSLRYLLPIDIPFGSEWTPTHKPIGIFRAPWGSNRSIKVRPARYAVFVRILGWILVPLGIAWLTGVFRYRG
jgi:uncharacterized protein YjbI with pentapeptide repeats